MTRNGRRSSPVLRAAAVVTLAVLPLAVATGGCKNGMDVPTATRAQMTQQMNDLANEIAQVIGHARVVNPTTQSTPCSSSSDSPGKVRYISAAYQVSLPDGRDPAIFQNVRDHWRDLGWKITEDSYDQNAQVGGRVSAKAPDEGSGFTLINTDSPKLLAIIAGSGCYRETG
jgi:hypothetical protein